MWMRMWMRMRMRMWMRMKDSEDCGFWVLGLNGIGGFVHGVDCYLFSILLG